MASLHLHARPWTTASRMGNALRRRLHPHRSSRRRSSANTDGARTLRSGLHRILTDEQRSLLNQVNQLSSMSRSLARQVGNVPVKEDSLLADIARLQTLRRQRQQTSSTAAEEKAEEATDDTAPPSLFTVVFAGEFNSGKSTLINALLGNEMLDAGVLPTTDAITILMANEGAETDEGSDESFAVESGSIGLDAGVSAHTQLHLLPTTKFPILSDLCLIDTPGTNAIMSLAHTSSTLRILHDADLIVFVTSADRPFSESEKKLLHTSIKSYRKRVVLVINKMDVLERQQGEDHGDETKRRVEEYVVEHAGDLLGARPVVIPLSARDALSVKLLSGTSGNVGNENPLWKRSNFGSLEHFLLESLTSTSKVRTKLLNPLGVSEGILIDCQSELQRRQEELDVDVMTLRLLLSQTDAWETETKVEVIDKCQSKIREAISMRSEVATRVLDDIGLFEQLQMGAGMGRSAFDRAWMRATQRGQSIPNTSKDQSQNSSQHLLGNELQSISQECAETLTSRAQSQGNASIEYLGKRPAIVGKDGAGISRMVGSVITPKFEQLKQLQPSMTSTIQNSTASFPSDTECATQVYSSLRQTALLSSMLVGSSTIPGALYVSGVLDATTGMVGSGILAAIGGITLPLGNRYIASSYKKEWIDNASQIESALETLLRDALQRVRTELSDSIAPYSRYVETELEFLKELSEKTESGISSAHSLRSKINKACQ